MAQVFDTPINSNDQSLDRVLQAGLPVMLVFVEGASPLDDPLKRLARAHAGQVLIVKVPARDNPVSTRRFNVQATPAVVTIKQGQTLSQAEAVSPAEVERHVAFLLGQGPRPAARPQTTARSAASDGSGAKPQAPPRSAPGHSPGQPWIVTDASFEQDVLRSPEPVLIDFWAPWCGPCHMVAPVVERLAHELSGRLRVAKVNVDENPGLSGRYGVQSIPTMMIFKNGQPIDRWVGAQPEPAIRQHLRQALGLG